MTRRTTIRLSVAFLAIIHAMILLAGYVAPYPYEEQHRDHPYSAPTRIHFKGFRPDDG